MSDPTESTPKKKKPRYFERPDSDVKPHTLLEVIGIVLSTHLGVRTAKQRQEDFRRANGLQLFIAGILYFVVIIIGIVLLVRHVAG